MAFLHLSYIPLKWPSIGLSSKFVGISSTKRKNDKIKQTEIIPNTQFIWGGFLVKLEVMYDSIVFVDILTAVEFELANRNWQWRCTIQTNNDNNNIVWVFHKIIQVDTKLNTQYQSFYSYNVQRPCGCVFAQQQLVILAWDLCCAIWHTTCLPKSSYISRTKIQNQILDQNYTQQQCQASNANSFREICTSI